MKIVTCTIVALLFNITLYAQNNIGLLLKRLETAKSDTIKVDVYGDIFLYYEYSNPDSCVYYMQQGLDYFTHKKFRQGIARITSLMANEDMAQGRVELARKRDNQALAIYNELNYKDGIAFVNNSLGTIDGKSGNYDDAMRHFLIALKAFESTSNRSGIQATYLKLGVVNERTGNIDKALDYYNHSMEMARLLPDSSNVILLYNNIGIIHGKKGEYKEAMACFERAIQMSDSPKLVGVRMLSLMNKGIVYDHMGDNRKALEFYNLALDIARSKNFPEDYARITLNMVSIIEHTDRAKALSMLASALDTARRIGQRSLQAEIMDGMIGVAKEQGEYKQALALQEQYSALKDSMFNIDKAKEIANLQSVYELDKSNEKVKQLTLSEKRNERKKDIIILVACGLLLTLIALTFFYRKSQRLNAQLAKREAELRKANTVKDKLFSIIGHDLRAPIANAPYMIDIYRQPSTTAEEKTYLLDSLKENATASLDTLDKLLYWGQSQIRGISINRIDLKVADNVQNIIRLMNGNADKKQIRLRNTVPADTVVLADAAHFDFVLRNLLSNAIKFTNTNGLVEIAADNSMRPGFTVFSVKDNGVGMSEEQMQRIFEPLASSTLGTANERGTSIGLMLCKEFVRENGGDIWVKSETGKGSTFYFSLPRSA